jgi:hypothetical protein
MATLTEGVEFARRLRELIHEAYLGGFYLHVDGEDLDLRDIETDDWIVTVVGVEGN